MRVSDKKPEVAIACAWYNRADYIDETLGSLLNQDYSNFNVVLINDGSPNQRVASVLDGYNDERLKVIHQKNTGFTVAIKRAIDFSSSPFVAVMGAGDKVHPDKLSKQIDYLLSHPEAGAVGCGHRLISATTGRVISNVQAIPKLDRTTASTLRRKVPFTQGTIVYRREVLEAAGHYDSFFKIAQDRDLYWRILEISEIHSIDECLYDKYVFEDGVTFRPDLVVYKGFYSQLARSQDRAKIEYYRENPGEIPSLEQMDSPRYLKYTLRKIAALIIRREWSIARQWFSLAFKQSCNYFRAAR